MDLSLCHKKACNISGWTHTHICSKSGWTPRHHICSKKWVEYASVCAVVHAHICSKSGCINLKFVWWLKIWSELSPLEKLEEFSWRKTWLVKNSPFLGRKQFWTLSWSRPFRLASCVCRLLAPLVNKKSVCWDKPILGLTCTAMELTELLFALQIWTNMLL